MFLRTEVIHVHLPNAQNLAEYANEYMGQFGIGFDESVLELLIKSIDKLSKIKYYHGYRTVEILCNDIVYSVMSEEALPKTILSAVDIKDFSEDSEYIKKTEFEGTKRIALGFRTE